MDEFEIIFEKNKRNCPSTGRNCNINNFGICNINECPFIYWMRIGQKNPITNQPIPNENDKQWKIKGKIVSEFEFYKHFYEENEISILQYKNLRLHFQKMVYDILGEDYYNLAMDVYSSDRITCEDITQNIINKR